MRRALATSLLAAFGALGCGPNFEDQSQLTTLRVLGVRKDKPYASPGDTVKLGLLYDDATLTDTDAGPKSKRDVQVAWFSGCENPPADLYALCFVQLAEAFKGSVPLGGGPVGDGGAPSKGPKPQFGAGPEFSFSLSPTIISRRQPPTDNSAPYGLAYVFFFVCAGTLDLAPAGQDFPIACYSKSHEQLGAKDFVAGYTAVYAYNGFHNANPVIKGFQVDGSTVTPECIDDACLLEEGVPASAPSDAGIEASIEGGPEGGAADAGSDAGLRSATDAGTPRSDAGTAPVDPCRNPKAPTCLEVCDTDNADDCPEHDVKLVTETSVEDDAVANARDHGSLKEQSWINYYVDAGKLVHDVKLLGDATSGYNEDHGTQIRVPKKLGVFHVWAVAHDSRGGTSWLKVALATRPKK